VNEKPSPEITSLNREYFEGCALGELRVRRCLACEARFRFAHEWCPVCWSGELGWVKASGRGKVSHFSIVHQAPSPAFEPDAPYVIALVELDEGVRMMSTIKGCAPHEVAIGMRVEAGFEARNGADIPIFHPAGSLGVDTSE